MLARENGTRRVDPAVLRAEKKVETDMRKGRLLAVTKSKCIVNGLCGIGLRIVYIKLPERRRSGTLGLLVMKLEDGTEPRILKASLERTLSMYLVELPWSVGGVGLWD